MRGILTRLTGLRGVWNMGSQAIELYRGNNVIYTVIVYDLNGNTVNITGASITLSVKETVNDTSYQFQLSSDDIAEINLTDPTVGEFKFYIIPANTEDMRPSKYVYDIEVILVSGSVYTIIYDNFILIGDVTRP